MRFEQLHPGGVDLGTSLRIRDELLDVRHVVDLARLGEAAAAARVPGAEVALGELGDEPVPHDRGVPPAHAQLLAVTAQIERSFSDNGRQPTAEELAIAESVREAVCSSAAYLATTEPVQAQIASAHTQLVAAFSKEMVYADGEMLAEYGAMDAMEPLPQETVERERVNVGKEKVTDTETVSDELRTEHIEVEGDAAEDRRGRDGGTNKPGGR